MFVDKAATKIQAVYRGHKVRASMKQGDSSSSKAKEADKPSSNANSTADQDQSKEQLAAEFREDDKGESYI